MPAAGGDGGDHVVDGFGDDQADRNLAIDGKVVRVERAAPVVEAYFAADRAAKLARQFFYRICTGADFSGRRHNEIQTRLIRLVFRLNARCDPQI